MEHLAGGRAEEKTIGQRAGRTVNTFVVRRWEVAGAEARYAIAHLQSGRHTVATNDAVAAAWIGGFKPGAVCPADHPIAARAQ